MIAVTRVGNIQAPAALMGIDAKGEVSVCQSECQAIKMRLGSLPGMKRGLK